MKRHAVQESRTDDCYISFMCNPENRLNCADCPENRGWFPNAKLPCGQQNCWVDCHCKEEEDEE